MSTSRTTRSAAKAAQAVAAATQGASSGSGSGSKAIKPTQTTSTTNTTKESKPTTSTSTHSLPILQFNNANEWETWLENNGTSSSGLFLQINKKNANIPSTTLTPLTLTYDQAVDVALCYGWIDGQRKSLDDVAFLQRFTPRRKGSVWSKRNVEKVGRLSGEGRMRAQGELEVERAKGDGRWGRAYGGMGLGDADVPEDFRGALEGNEKALGFWETLSKSKKSMFLFRIGEAKRVETRRKRIGEFVKLLAARKSLG